MTTLAKIEANQRNAELSTGPRTVEGKAVVARNATRHGIFSAVPVIPGECPEEWDTHRAGVVNSLAPEGLLEVNLAERAALLLWRLQRLARYESEVMAAAMEEAAVPPLPPFEERNSILDPPEHKTRDEHLQLLRRKLRTAREELPDLVASREFFEAGSGAGADATVAFGVAETILNAACGYAGTAENLRSDPPAFESRAFLRRLGQAGADPRKATWTADLVRRGLEVYAGFTEESIERFIAAVRADVEDWAADLVRKVKQLELEVDAVARLLDNKIARKQAAKILPCAGRDERIAKYEKHLHGLLTSTLHELERLQARREGEHVPSPAVADVNLTIDAV